jgi:hypothetical protein
MNGADDARESAIIPKIPLVVGLTAFVAKLLSWMHPIDVKPREANDPNLNWHYCA